MNSIFASLPTTIFESISRLAIDHQAVNLGQGFPDDLGAEDIRAKAADAVMNGNNQYPPMLGLPELRNATAAHYKQFQGLALDPATEIMITAGATEALAAAFFGLIEPGDEVVLMAPMYDAYLPLVRRAGGVPRILNLEPPHWRLTEEKLSAVFTPRTKLVVFNNPLNPSARAFDRQELSLLAHYCMAHDTIAICDEVWEHIMFDGIDHIPLMAVPGMRERTVKISSAGKIFSLTGWKIGMVMAAPPLLKQLAKTHQFLTFTIPPNLQTAVAYGLAKPPEFYAQMRQEFQGARDYFVAGLKTIGFQVLPCDSTYFVNIDIAPLGLNDDADFCRRLVTEIGVAAIPVSAFYPQGEVRNIVRFCFAKKRKTLDAALERLDRAPRVFAQK